MKIRREYTAREIAAMSDDQLNQLPKGGLWIQFDNNAKVKCKTYKTVYTAPFWSFIVKHGGRILPRHSMFKMDGDDVIEAVYTTSTHLTLSELAFWDTFYEGDTTPERFWQMSEDIYLATNRIYNFNVRYDLRFMSTLSLNDVMQVMKHPKIRQFKKDWLDKKISLEECHDGCYKVLETDTEYFKDNDIHRSVRCQLLSKTQVKQMIGPRGNVPDITSEAFPHIIEAGYYERLNYAYDSIVDSKSASIALYMQGGPLEDSEYNNRCCQLACTYIRRVVYRDCGSRSGLTMVVKDKAMLKALVGKNALTNEGEYRIKGNEESLIGKTITVRSMATCMEKEQGVKCSHCIGQTAYTIPPNASPGLILIIDPLGQISQTILSTKHVLSNVIALTLDLDNVAKRYMHLHEDNKFVVMLNDDLDYQNTKLRVHHSEAQFLSDLDRVDDAGKINITAISDIFQMAFVRTDGNVTKDIKLVDTSVSGVGSCFTPEALRYIKAVGWKVVGDMLEIDLSDWNSADPLLVTKRVSQDVTETLRQFRSFINPPDDPKKRIGKTILDCGSVEEAVDQLYTVLSAKLRVSTVQMETFVTALMANPDNWLLPRGDEPYRFVSLNNSLMNRSAVVTLGYQYQLQYITKPETYLKDKNTIPPHEFDGLVAEGLGFHYE